MPNGSSRYRLIGALLPLLAVACGGGDLVLPGGGPAGLETVSGDGQQAEVGALLPDPLVVRATDGSGRPVAGALIVFRFDGDVGGEIAPDTALTDSEGRARAEIRLGSTSGAQVVEAAAVDVPEPPSVTFELTALAVRGPPGRGGDGDDDDDEVDGGGGNGNHGGGNGHGHGGGGDDDDDDDDD